MDIDKAYIMGLSYNDNALYIKWSPLFNYNSAETLLASKTLPIPKGITITKGDAYNVTKLLNTLDATDISYVLDDVANRASAKFIRQLADIIRIAEKYKALNYNGDEKLLDKLISVINRHEHYKIAANVAESAFKNVASSNIYLVSHDIRNRDLAYTAISMGILRKASNKSPKGDLVTTLNMLNPLTKYIMQYLNLVGKNVISVAANGEKLWFNLFYYWTKVLKSGDSDKIAKLKYVRNFNRISGRADGTLLEHTSTHIPDLNKYDNDIKLALLDQFLIDTNTEEYKYVDLLISLLLSASTDNAKELILAKINAGTNFAKMYIQGMILGFNVNDLVAFMTCPVVDLIDRLALPNIFLHIDGTPNMAINMVQGIVGVKKFLHGTVAIYDNSIEGGSKSYKKTTYTKNLLLSTSIWNKVREFNNIEDDSKLGLSEVMKAFIKYATDNKDVNLTLLFNVRDTEINYYLSYCQDLIDKLRVSRDLYSNVDDFNADIEEFAKLYNDADEISSISSAWLGLNLGIPTSELDILKRLQRMTLTVTNRESLFNIKDSELFPTENTTEKAAAKMELKRESIINTLHGNNPTLSTDYIRELLEIAHEVGIINNFDVIEYLINDDYKLKISNYYGIIKGTTNVFELMDSLPLYKLILNLFKTVVVGKNTLSSKSRLVRKLSGDVKLDDLNNVIKYVDNLNVINFIQTLPIITLNTSIESFNPYFLNTTSNMIDLSSIEGMMTFKHFIEHEFLDYLNDNYESNLLVKHLTLVPDKDSNVLATDIDLLNPNATLVSRQAYNDILRGMSDFEGIKFNEDFTIADMLLLYNIIVNKNLYGAERLTTAFKVCKNPNNILNLYLDFTAKLDWRLSDDLMYSKTDLQIALAPVVSVNSESRHSEPFIKVRDELRGYILKRYNAVSNSYSEYNVIPTVGNKLETAEVLLPKLKNYMENSPFEMPSLFLQLFDIRAIDHEENPENPADINKMILNIITNYITSNKALLVKECI